MHFRSSLLSLLVLFSLILTGCAVPPPPMQPTPVPPTATAMPEPTAVPTATTEPTATPVAEMPEAQPVAFLSPLGSYATGIADASGSEIVAYDPGSQRIFSTNAANNTLDILDAQDPANLSLLLSVDMNPYGAAINSVSVSNGLVAAAVAADAADAPGQIVFLNPDGDVLANVEAGALPDMVTFTPDGMTVLSANEGEPNGDYTVDPEGSITIVDLSGGVENLSQDDVTQLSFAAFNDAESDPAIRTFGPNATVAQDLEPEYIAVSADGSTAYVTLQEANALAVVDIANRAITGLVALGFKDHSRPTVTLDTYTFDSRPVLGQTPAGQEILLGGFSGLYFEGTDAEGNWQFITHPDRGPNAEPVDTDGDGINDRPFPLPDFQTQWVRLQLNPATGELTIVEQVGLTRADGTPITGLPNLAGEEGMAYADEKPIDLLGNALQLDPYGGDFEGIVRAADNSFWMVDEYRPAIYHFDETGMLIDRFVPVGSGAETGIEALPAVFAQRRPNRGFEGVAMEGDILYAFIQSPLDNPDVANDASSKASLLNRILAFDTAKSETIGEYLYVIDGGPVDKIGDAVAVGNGEFLVIERDSAVGVEAKKYIYHINLAGATNLLELDPALVGIDGGLEQWTLEELAAQGIQPVQKRLYVDLIAAGYLSGDKAEGLAFIDANTLAVINDNDFGLLGTFDVTTGALDDNPDAVEPVLGILHLSWTGLDASDKDGGINIRNWPVLGMYMPDSIAAFAVEGETYIISANEGDSRDYDGYSEETRVADLTLDATAYPDAAMLQADENLGRLKTTTATGDTDGDGDVDQIYSFGARSFSIWDSQGALVWDSGDQFERILAERMPDFFNAQSGDEMDSRSDDKGGEPEAVTVGVIDGRTYAFIGLERMSGIFVYDVSEPMAPVFVDYADNWNPAGSMEDGSAGDVSPEGFKFVPAEESPTGGPLLIVANEVSGTVSVWAINP